MLADTQAAAAVPSAAASTTTTTKPHNEDASPSPAPTAAAATVPVSQELPPRAPTYESVENSRRYQVAKTLLQEGEFEDALTTIAEGLEEVKAQLLASNDDDVDETTLDFHPALAPLHYLYGTTLLYSVEESSDDLQTGMGGGDTNNPADGDAADAAEDVQIAYENLDISRVIVEQYLALLETSSSSSAAPLKSDSSEPQNDAAANDDVSPKSVAALQLDLAQIRLREGDLHRLDGQYTAAQEDYRACLQLRARHLDRLDRKLADVHYNLALAYALQVAAVAGATTTTTTSDTAPPVAAAAAAATAAPEETSEPTTLTPQQLAQARGHAAYHFLQCGRILCGQLTQLAGGNVDEFYATVQAALPVSNQKTTGDDDWEDPERARTHVRTLRQHVEALLPPPPRAIEVESLWSLLEEIQETVDEADNAEAGVHQVAQLKSEIAAAASGEALAAKISAAEEPSFTSAATSTTTTTAAFGSQAAAALTATAQPVMAVRKKKRPPPAPADNAKDDHDDVNHKQPNKHAKTASSE